MQICRLRKLALSHRANANLFATCIGRHCARHQAGSEMAAEGLTGECGQGRSTSLLRMRGDQHVLLHAPAGMLGSQINMCSRMLLLKL